MKGLTNEQLSQIWSEFHRLEQGSAKKSQSQSQVQKKWIPIPIPIPGLKNMNPNPNLNPKIFQIQSQSQSQNLQNSIPIPKIRPNPKQSQEILGIPIPKIYLWKTSSIGKKERNLLKTEQNSCSSVLEADRFYF